VYIAVRKAPIRPAITANVQFDRGPMLATRSILGVRPVRAALSLPPTDAAQKVPISLAMVAIIPGVLTVIRG
jgi:hypothetical protein